MTIRAAELDRLRWMHRGLVHRRVTRNAAGGFAIRFFERLALLKRDQILRRKREPTQAGIQQRNRCTSKRRSQRTGATSDFCDDLCR